MDYGPHIERARRRAGLSQARLAALIGKDQGTVSGYENDRFRPDLDGIALIARATGASLDELILGSDPSPSLAPDDRAILDIVHALGLSKDEVIRRICAPSAQAPHAAPARPEVPAIQAAGPVGPPRPGKPAKRA